MKKSKLLLIVYVLFICFSTIGCQADSRASATIPGSEKTIVDGETVKVISAEISDKKITVDLELNFNKIQLSDFKTIAVSKNQDGSKFIAYDVDETHSVNEDDIFDNPYKGKVTLVFKSDDISIEHDVSNYCFYLEYLEDDGIMNTNRFALK